MWRALFFIVVVTIAFAISKMLKQEPKPPEFPRNPYGAPPTEESRAAVSPRANQASS